MAEYEFGEQVLNQCQVLEFSDRVSILFNRNGSKLITTIETKVY